MSNLPAGSRHRHPPRSSALPVLRSLEAPGHRQCDLPDIGAFDHLGRVNRKGRTDPGPETREQYGDGDQKFHVEPSSPLGGIPSRSVPVYPGRIQSHHLVRHGACPGRFGMLPHPADWMGSPGKLSPGSTRPGVPSPMLMTPIPGDGNPACHGLGAEPGRSLRAGSR